MHKDIRDYTISEIVEFPSSLIDSLNEEDKNFYVSTIIQKDNSCKNIFAEILMFVNEKDLDIKQKLIINNIVRFGSKENIKDFLINNSENNVFSYTAILEMSFYIDECNKKDFYEKTEDLIFNYNLEFDNQNEITKSGQEEFRHTWLKNAFLYIDKNYLIEKWHKDYINIIDNLSYSDFHIKAEMFWRLCIYKNEEVYQTLLKNPDYHYLLAGDRKSQNFDLRYQNEKMECIMSPQVNKNCISLIFQYADFSNIEKIQTIICDLVHIKSINKVTGINKPSFTFSTCFCNFNQNTTTKDFIDYFSLYQQYIDSNLNIINEFFNVADRLNKNLSDHIDDYNSTMNIIYLKIRETEDSKNMFKLVNLWLKNLSLNNVDKIVNIINENDLKYKFSHKYDFYKEEDKTLLIIAEKEDPKNVKPILKKIMPYIKDVKILRRSLIKELLYSTPNSEKRNEVTNEIFDYFCKTKYKKNIFDTKTMEEILKGLNSYIKSKCSNQSLNEVLDKAANYFNKTEFYIFLKTHEDLINKDKEYKNLTLDHYKMIFEQNMLLDKMKNKNMHSKMKRI